MNRLGNNSDARVPCIARESFVVAVQFLLDGLTFEDKFRVIEVSLAVFNIVEFTLQIDALKLHSASRSCPNTRSDLSL